MTWTVVTVSFNSEADLTRCWTASRGHDWLVVDNQSTDGSAATARRLGARTMVLPRNVGFAAANNVGARAARSEYLLFANPDVSITDDGLGALAEHLDRHGGIVAPQLLYPDGAAQPNGRGFPYVTAKIGNRTAWPLHRSYRIVAAPHEVRWTPWCIGAALAVRRADFLAIGGWNERFFLYYEDAELCLRMWRHGQPVAVHGGVRWVHHWRRATASLRWSSAHTWEVRSAATFYRMFPEFVVGVPAARRRHPAAASRAGGLAIPAPVETAG